MTDRIRSESRPATTPCVPARPIAATRAAPDAPAVTWRAAPDAPAVTRPTPAHRLTALCLAAALCSGFVSAPTAAQPAPAPTAAPPATVTPATTPVPASTPATTPATTPGPVSPAASPAAPPAPSPAAAPAAAAPKIAIVGDSLSAGYGLPAGVGWVELLRARLASVPGAQLVNASISGDTTAGGLSRLPGLLMRQKPTLVVLELGGNDALRGLDPEHTRANLARMIELSQQAGARVVLLAMNLPPNFGAAYAERFAAMYPALARQYGLGDAPFLLDGFATDLARFQPDRIHPDQGAQQAMLDNAWPAIEAALRAR